jgi:nucleoside-diphosphate-sugar epimerase
LDYADPHYVNGIAEDFTIDQSKHSLFGASKVAADIMVQEYGRYFNIPTCCLRGGCLTGPNHTGVELHGFLSYLIRCNLTRKEYKIFGYKGKQVRDNIHSLDVARFINSFIKRHVLPKFITSVEVKKIQFLSWKHLTWPKKYLEFHRNILMWTRIESAIILLL